LASIDATTHAGLRDRALIALMVYSFARIGAALGMNVEDVYTQNRRLWVWYERKAASAMKCPATIILRNILWRIWIMPTCATIQWDHYFVPLDAVRANYHQLTGSSECPRHDTATYGCRRNCDQNRQP
ncbi:MAG: hypothetical protein ABJA60_11960, partial [Nitrosospira sp.]